MTRRLIWAAAGLALAGVVAGAALALSSPPAPGHTRFHIGCLDHNHGPKWHAGHGRAALVPASRFSRPDTAADPPAGRD